MGDSLIDGDVGPRISEFSGAYPEAYCMVGGQGCKRGSLVQTENTTTN